MRIVKTFPIVLTIDFHTEIKKLADKQHLSMNKFFIAAAEEKIKRDTE